MSESFEAKTERNRRVMARYDELMQIGRHGHYETMFRVVREEVERALAAQAATTDHGAPAITINEHAHGDDHRGRR